MRILVGVDGSVYSQAAIQAVLNHPWPANSEIHLLSVIRTLDSIVPMVELFVDTRSGPKLGELYGDAKRQLEAMATDLAQVLPGCHWTSDVRVGDVSEGLMEIAEEWQADLLVVGSHGHTGGLAKVILGSVSQALVTHAPCPVLVVKQSQHLKPEQTGGDFKRILVPLDDSYFSGVAMHWIAAREWAPDAQFTLLHIANHDIKETPAEIKARHGEHETPAQHKHFIHEASLFALNARADWLGARMGHHRFTCKVMDGKPSAAIVDLAEKSQADLIVMGSHGHTSKALRMLGSTTAEVTAHASCSVEIVRVPHSLLPGADHSRHQHEHTDPHIQIIDEPRREHIDSRPHVPPPGIM